MPRLEEVDDLDDGAPGALPVITGDYSRHRAGSRGRSSSGPRSAKPSAVFTKLDPSVVDDELGPAGRRRRAPSRPAERRSPAPVRARASRSVGSGLPTPAGPAADRRGRQPHPPRHHPRRREPRRRRGGDRAAGGGRVSTGWCRSAATCRRPLHRRGRRPAPPGWSAASPCTPTRFRAGGGGGLEAAYAEIERLAAHPGCGSIGETGLDYFRTGPEGVAGTTGLVPLAHRPRQAARQGAADPRPRRPRRRAAHPRRGGCARAHGAALLLGRRRRWPASASSAATTSRSPAR